MIPVRLWVASFILLTTVFPSAMSAEECSRERIQTVTTWTGPNAQNFDGPTLSCSVFGREAKLPRSGEVLCGSLNGYQVKIPVDLIRQMRPILADRQNGEVLTLRKRGPKWLIWPRSSKSLNSIFDDYFIWSVDNCQFLSNTLN